MHGSDKGRGGGGGEKEREGEKETAIGLGGDSKKNNRVLAMLSGIICLT